LHGAPIERDELLREADMSDAGEIVGARIVEHKQRISGLLARRGFPSARVSITTRATDDPMRVLVIVDVQPGPPRTIARRIFYPSDPTDEHLRKKSEDNYPVKVGDRQDETVLATADIKLEAALRASGWHRADVSHDVVLAGGLVTLRVRVDAGPRFAV